MSRIFIILSLVFLNGCVTTKIEEIPKELKITEQILTEKKEIPKIVLKEVTNPDWYKTTKLQVNKENEVIGFAKAKTLYDATLKAKKNLLLKIMSKMDSSYTHEINPNNLRILEYQQIEDEFFIAILYENSDLVYRFKTTIGEVDSSDKNINKFIKETPIFRNITNAMNYQLDIRVQRKEKQWYLKYKENLFLLKNDELKEFFSSVKNENFEFKASKKNLVDSEKFYFTFKTKESGYITLVDIYDNGIVTLLDSSIDIKKSMQIPPKQSNNFFEAVLMNEEKNTTDLYIAIFTKEPIDMIMFDYLNKDLSENEEAFKFDIFLQIINNYEFASVVIETKPE